MTERLRLAELIELQYGFPLPRDERDPDGAFPVAGSNGVDGFHSAARVPGPGIVVGRKGSAGKVTFYECDFWPIDTTYFVSLKRTENLKWVYYLLQALHLQELATATGVPGLSRDLVYALEVDVPNPRHQERIAGLLDRVDAVRRKRAEADHASARILPALFLQMFGDPVMRFPTCRLEGLLRQKNGALQSGPFGSELHNHDFVVDGTVLAVGIDNVHDTGFELGRQRRISQQKFEDLRRFALEADDVLVTVMGTIGRTCVFPAWAGDAICTKHVYRIQTDPEVVHPEFLAACFRFSPSVRAQLGASMTGQIVKGLTSRDLRALSLGVPPIDLQRTFARLKASLDAHLAKTRMAASQLERIFDSLMSRAFSIEAGTPPDPRVASSSLAQEPS